MRSKKILVILFLILLVAGGYLFFGKGFLNEQVAIKEINSFEDCELAKYPVQESYPRRCVLPDGTMFTEEIGEEIESDIVLVSPRPNAIISSPFKISGEAVGSWFFEASFTADLVNNEGEVISTAILTAGGEWMTEEMVPFSGELEFDNVSAGNGKLILKSANPSGLPEHQKIFSISVKF